MSDVRTFDLGRILKEDGEPFVGARVAILVPGYSGVAGVDGHPQTLAELFADEECTTPLANPLIVSADGTLPLWFIRADEDFIGVSVEVRG